MANKKVLGVRPDYSYFTNPSDEHYAMADELRPDSILYADELLVWDRISPLLASLGRLHPWYIDTLCEYCRVIVSLAKNAKYLREEGDVYEVSTRNGLQKKNRPEVGQRNEDRRMLRSYVGDFGLTPAAERQFDEVQSDIINEFGLLHMKANAG